MQLLFCGEQTGMKICETLGTLGLQKKVLKSLLSTTHMFRQKKKHERCKCLPSWYLTLSRRAVLFVLWGFIEKDIRDCEKQDL